MLDKEVIQVPGLKTIGHYSQAVDDLSDLVGTFDLPIDKGEIELMILG